MSLKAFHVLFICVSTLFSAGFGAWALNAYRNDGQWLDLVFGIGSLLGAVALLVYGWFFLKKLKSVSYL